MQKDDVARIAVETGHVEAYNALLRHGMYELQKGREYPAFVLEAAKFLEREFPHITENRDDQ